MNELEVIKFIDVSKKLGDKQILKNVNLTVEKGKIIGIIGTNGSGKTTILKLAAGLIYATDGKVLSYGNEIKAGFRGDLTKNTAVLIESPTFLNFWSGYDNLYHLSKIRNIISRDKIKDVMISVGLKPENKKRVSTYSLGMRQRLGIAQAFMEDPALVLLDEPTNGLDKDGIKMFEKIVEQSKLKGASIILVSHDDKEIENLCDKVYKLENSTLIEQEQIVNQKIKLFSSDDIVKVLRLEPKSYMDNDNEGIVMVIPLNKKDDFYERMEDQKIKFVKI